MRKFTVQLILIQLFILLSNTSVVGQQINIAKLDSLMELLKKNDKAMGSLAVSVDSKLIYSRAIGFSHVVNGNPVPSSTSTRYRIGSISKMFTATMIFQLIEENKISLDAKLVQYFPDIPNSYLITIQHLLTHRSGIPDFTTDSTYSEWKGETKSQEDILKLFYSRLPDFVPGTKAVYSNSNFIVLGYILEKITNKKYSDLLQEQICSKIGLKNTYCGSKIDPAHQESQSYIFNFGWYQQDETDMSIPNGAGSIVSTSDELVVFIESLFAGKLISQTSLNKMLEQKEGIGMGIFQFPFGDRSAYGHSGSIDAFASNLAYFPAEKLAVAYIANGQVYPLNDIMIGVLSICFNKDFKFPAFKTYPLTVNKMMEYTGSYFIQNAPLIIKIFLENEQLFAQATGQDPFPLTPIDKDKFVFEQGGLVLVFNLYTNEMTLNQGGQLFLFSRGAGK